MGISKGKLFYKAKGTSKQDLEMMKEMDKEHMDNPGKESSALRTGSGSKGTASAADMFAD